MGERLKYTELALGSSLLFFLTCLIAISAFPSRPCVEIKERDQICGKCSKTSRNLESHHICHESIAIEFGIPHLLYNHISNGRALCGDCHDKYHSTYKTFSEIEKRTMVLHMLERIIDYHQTTDIYQLRELYRRKVLMQHPSHIESMAHRYLRKLRREDQELERSARRRRKRAA